MDDIVVKTASGAYFNLSDPSKSTPYLYDIAHALAHTCRYNGHCVKFYSVAEHSIHVSYSLPDDMALHGLMHDAAEAYIGDIIYPIKRVLGDFVKELEDSVLARIYEHFGIEEPSNEVKQAVKNSDTRALVAEKHQLLHADVDDDYIWREFSDTTPLDMQVKFMAPTSAIDAFISEYQFLTRGREKTQYNIVYAGDFEPGERVECTVDNTTRVCEVVAVDWNVALTQYPALVPIKPVISVPNQKQQVFLMPAGKLKRQES